ncbi:MAG: ABC transporter ATP-binding protein [Firmicutes bacterium]|nr:ABC transporter ATP-binding protein [Bacillota bacterium]
MKRLTTYIRPYKKECVIAPLLKCMEALVDLFVPLCMADLVDIGIHDNNVPYIWRIGLILFGLALLGLAFSVIAQWFAAKAATGFAAGLRRDTFHHIQTFSFSSTDQIGTDTLITRLTSDINQTQTGINMGLRLLLRSPFIVFGAMIMAFRVDVPSAWIFAVTIPVLAIIVYGIMWITIPLYKKVQSQLDSVVSSTRENLTGVRVIRAFRLQEQERNSFEEKTDLLTIASEKVGRFSALTNPLTYVIINLATAYLIYQGALRVNIGSLTQGQVIALLNYMAQILVELVKLANLIVTLTKAVASAGRVEAILLTESDMRDGTKDFPEDTTVRFDHVSFTYKAASEESLTDISFCANPGETIGIIGGTGSGKTTLVNLIPRFYDASGGQITIGGKDIRELRLSGIRSSIADVLQKALLFRGTIRDNMHFGLPGASDEEIWDALKAAQAAEFVLTKPALLDAPIEQGGRNLSGGQRQRLTIARALVRKPKILILDDSASALDFATDAALRHAIKELPDHPTTFIVSQRVSSIMYADQILVLDRGALAGKGRHEELLRTCHIYREIYETQIRKESEGKEVTRS